jgi:putative ABC transport system ATP-binding protein
MILIETRNLQKNYQSPAGTISVLQAVNIKVDSGEFIGIVGPSGSGKSTLLYVMSGLEPPTSGEVVLFKKPIKSMTESDINEIRKNKIGFVFQFYNLLPNLTVLENVELPLVIAKNRNMALALSALEVVGLQDVVAMYPAQLSGGMQQRVAIARAIVNDPKIIFADEPTGNLDLQTGKEIMELLKRLNLELGVTIVLVTHNLDHLTYCTRKLELVNGIVKNDAGTKV